MRVFLLVIKFLILAVLYLFIFRVFKYIIRDLRRTAEREAVYPAVQAGACGAELVATESRDPHIRKGDVIYLGGETRIGRGVHNHINMADSFASHDHALITCQDENFYLQDLNSVNGTYINGMRVSEPTLLRHGDTIRIAGATFKFARWEYEME